MEKNPCHNCITLPICIQRYTNFCKGLEEKYSRLFSYSSKYCSSLNVYLDHINRYEQLIIHYILKGNVYKDET